MIDDGAVRRRVGGQLRRCVTLGRFLARQPDVPVGSVRVRYDAEGRLVGVVLLVLTVAELVVVDVVVPWTGVRVVLLVLSVWTLLLLGGLVAGPAVRPHLVSPGSVRLRHGDQHDVHVPTDGIAAIRARRRDAPGRTLTVADGVLALAVQGTTTVELSLVAPGLVTVDGRDAEVHTVWFAADDPSAAVAAVGAVLRTNAG